MRVRAIPMLTFGDRTGISTHTAFMAVRLFVIGLVETDGSPPSLSADLFRRNPVVLMTFATAFLCRLNSSSSSPLVAGVSTVEPALLLERGAEETLAEVEVAEASKRSVIAFPVALAMIPTITARLRRLPEKTLTVVYSQVDEPGEDQVDDES
jgi:hypothetical protein